MTSISRTKISHCIFLLLVLASFVVPLQSFAQDAVTLSVSPTIFEMTGNPSQRWESTIRVINANPFELRVYAEVTNFVPLGESGMSRFIPVTEPQGDTFAEWISITREEIVIPPEQTREIPMVITVPDSAPPGGHFAAIQIGTKPPDTIDSTTQVQTSQVVTSLLFLRVSGEINETGSIRSFRATQSILEQPEATFELRFENKGNVHLQPQGEILITNMWGQERGRIPVNQYTLFGNVLPQSIRKFSFGWSGEWSLADIGRYQAEATIAYGSESRQFVTSETAFWIIPWKALLLIVMSIVSFIWFMSWAIKVYVRKMLSLAGVTPMSDTAVFQASPRAKNTQRRSSVVAPLEAGILDLRSQLSSRTSLGDTFSILIRFVRQNALFFIALLVLCVFIYAALWYFHNASTENRAYSVTVESGGSDLTVTSEEIEYSNLSPSGAVPGITTVSSSTTPAITVINRSGVNGAAAKVGLLLEEAQYRIESLDSDYGVVEDRTVIIYRPEYAETALTLSTLLDNALLSSYATVGSTTAAIVVYVGEDLVE